MPKQAHPDKPPKLVAEETGVTIGKDALGDLAHLQSEINEKEILLSLNNDIATVKNKNEILRVIHPKLKRLFNTDDIFICKLDKESETLTPFLRVADKARENHSDYNKILATGFPIEDRFIKTILTANEPVVFDIDEVCQWQAPPEYILISKATGLLESLSIPLTDGEEKTGVLTLWSDQKNFFTPHYQELIRKISAQISIIVNNISASELIREKENEINVLLAVSDAIASIRDKHDLVQIIQKTLRSFIQFSDIAITRFNIPKGVFKVFLEYCEKTNLHPDFKSIAYNEYPITDGIHDTIMNSEHTVVLSVRQLLKDGMVHIKFLEDAGIKELAGIRLQHNDNVIGTMVLLSDQENSFSPSSRRLIKEVAHHFATAMVNIIYHEEIQERSKENEILLSISSAFSSIREKEELLPILKQQLENLSFYSDVTITKVDSNNKTFSAFVVNEEAGRKNHPAYPQMRVAHHSFPDGVFEIALHSRTPVLFDLDEIVKRNNVPSYVKFMHQNGTVDMAGISLRDRNREIGAMFLFSDKKQKFSDLQLNLVQGIGNQLGTVMANILANEEIRNREYEKSVLLSFSKEIAAVRDKEDLLRVVSSRLKELFYSTGFGIALIDKEKQTYTYFLVDAVDNARQHVEFDDVVMQNYSVTDDVFRSVMNSAEPVIININELSEADAVPAYISFSKKLSIEFIAGVALRVGENNLGCLLFHLEENNLGEFRNNLLKGISAQISIALSNILSNEKIAHQLEVISRYKEQLEEEKQYLQEEVSSGYDYSDIIGVSPEMKKVFHLLSQVASANSTVLILGETGTGKELIARAIHNSSPRNDNLMVKVNCAVLPPNLIESELFGHEKGSFTGATERRIGKFELANNGTLFLDEIGEMPLDLQVKLLRAIQEKEIERIGGKSVIKVNVRLIAATNRQLQQEVEKERFRQDLFYRLNVFPITLPPLRERKEDIPLLVVHFMDKYAKNSGKKIKNISGKAMKELMAYSWPGNVRELEHLIERCVLMTQGSAIKEVHLPSNNKEEIKKRLEEEYLKTHVENERDHIIRVLNKCNGKIYGPGGAADILNLRVSTLNSKIKKLGIQKNKMFN